MSTAARLALARRLRAPASGRPARYQDLGIAAAGALGTSHLTAAVGVDRFAAANDCKIVRRQLGDGNATNREERDEGPSEGEDFSRRCWLRRVDARQLASGGGRQFRRRRAPQATAQAASLSPITIGASLSLSGDFSADGQAYQKGYELWASDQNKAGGLLGHPIKLDIISDASSTSQVVTNYEKLIGSDKDQLVFAPFSTLLTVPAARVAARYGYAMVGGADGGPTVFSAGLKNVFDVSIPVKNNLVTFAQWVASLPASKRPKTAAYVTVDDPFTQPQLPVAQEILKKAGVKTVLNKVFPEEATDYSAIANEVATAKPDIVVLGSVDVPTVSAFTHVFIQQHYNPKAFIATSGPDQGQQFVNAVGCRQRERHLRAERLVPGLQEGRLGEDGQGVRRQVRGHRQRRQR